MYYEINIAKKKDNGNYEHYFATAKRSITNKDTLIELLQIFTDKFSEPQYKITVSYHPENSNVAEAKDVLNNPEILYL